MRLESLGRDSHDLDPQVLSLDRPTAKERDRNSGHGSLGGSCPRCRSPRWNGWTPYRHPRGDRAHRGVTNDRPARHSSLAMDSDLLLGNDDGVLLIAAILFAGADHLLEARDAPNQQTPAQRRPHRRRSPCGPHCPALAVTSAPGRPTFSAPLLCPGRRTGPRDAVRKEHFLPGWGTYVPDVHGPSEPRGGSIGRRTEVGTGYDYWCGQVV